MKGSGIAFNAGLDIDICFAGGQDLSVEILHAGTPVAEPELLVKFPVWQTQFTTEAGVVSGGIKTERMIRFVFSRWQDIPGKHGLVEEPTSRAPGKVAADNGVLFPGHVDSGPAGSFPSGHP